MAAEDVSKFYTKAIKDKALLDQIQTVSTHLANEVTMKSDKEISDGDIEKIYRALKPIAKQVGSDFTVEDLKSYIKTPESLHDTELSDKEMDLVAGGGVSYCVVIGEYTGNGPVICFFGGA